MDLLHIFLSRKNTATKTFAHSMLLIKHEAYICAFMVKVDDDVDGIGNGSSDKIKKQNRIDNSETASLKSAI